MSDVTRLNAPAKERSSLARLHRRHRTEMLFQGCGILAIAFALLALAGLFYSVFSKAYTAFGQAEIAIEIDFDPAVIDPEGDRDPERLRRADPTTPLIRQAIRERFPDARGRRDRRDARRLVSFGAPFILRDLVVDDPGMIGTRQTVWLPADDDIDMFMKGLVKGGDEPSARVTARQVEWITALRADGQIEQRFNTRFFTAGDSREPELAGIRGAVAGSFLTLMVCLVLAFPLGVMTAIYLEEFAPKNRWISLIEVNINNLAAVPSIVFGLLGLAVLLGFMNMPRSAPLVGGIVLALMTLPTVIIAARVALQAVPPSIREAALAIGASPTQVVWHHVLPLGLPGIMTGTIIGMAQALGETAPLLMIGMVAFIVDVPGGFTDPATALPVQIYLWADSPERAFAERTAAAIVVLVGFLVVMNLCAIILRRRFVRRW